MPTGDPHNFGFGTCWCGVDHAALNYRWAFENGQRSGILPTQVIADRKLLEKFVDDDECNIDHHGGCQTHGRNLEPGPDELECPVVTLRNLLR